MNISFIFCGNLESIRIPKNIRVIKDSTFNCCDSLKSVYFAEDSRLEAIDGAAFAMCGNIEELEIPNSVKRLGSNIIGVNAKVIEKVDGIYYVGDFLIRSDASAVSVNVREGTRIIADSAFRYNNKVRSIILPDGVETIGSYAFANCTALKTIVIPDSVTDYQMDALLESPIESLTSPAFVLSYINFIDTSSVKAVSITSGTQVDLSMFLYCDDLISVTLGESITEIGDNTFSFCEELKTVVVLNPEAKISESAFGPYNYPGTPQLGCINIESATLPAYAFSYIPKDKLKVAVINGGESIGSSAFLGCTTLSEITIPSSIKTIGSSAFYNCTGLTKVHISDVAAWCEISFASFGTGNPLYYAKALYLNGELVTDFIIPAGVKKIGNYAFVNCESLQSVTLPEGIEEVSSNAFSGCTNLLLQEYGNAYYLGSGEMNPHLVLLKAKDRSITDCEIFMTTEVIAAGAFENCEYLEADLIIPRSVREINAGAFAYCMSIKSITFESGSNLKKIGGYGFYFVSSVKEIILPEGLESIGDYAFNICGSLRSINIPDSVTFLGKGAFAECSQLETVTLGANCRITEIPDELFYGDSHLKSFIIPETVTSIGEKAFCGCNSLESIYIPKSVKSIGDYAFRLCTSIISIRIPDGVKSIGNETFYGCLALKSIIIPASVRTIGDSAFDGCSKLETVNYMGSAADWNGITISTVANDHLKNADIVYNYILP